MRDFVTKYLLWAMVAVFIGIFVYRLVRLVRQAKKADREGLVADGIIIRTDPETAADGIPSCIVYVRYEDEHDAVLEGMASADPAAGYEAGDKVRIRYFPGQYRYIQIVEENKANEKDTEQ